MLYWRFGPRRITATDLATVAVATGLMALVTGGTSLWLIRLVMLGLGLGISLVFIPAQAASMATVSKAQTGRASSVFNAGKQLGGAVGVALLTTVLAAASTTATSTTATSAAGAAARGTAGPVGLAGFHDGFLAAAAVAVLALAVAWSVRDADAAPTMIRRGGGAGERRTGQTQGGETQTGDGETGDGNPGPARGWTRDTIPTKLVGIRKSALRSN